MVEVGRSHNFTHEHIAQAVPFRFSAPSLRVLCLRTLRFAYCVCEKESVLMEPRVEFASLFIVQVSSSQSNIEIEVYFR